MSKAVRLADIAKSLGVSTVTVSKALSGQKGVSDELRDKIRRVAEEMGYQPPSTQKKAQQKDFDIGVVISQRYMDKYDSFYWQMYQQLSMRASAKECFTLMEVIGMESERGNELPKLLQDQKVDGLIIVGRMEDHYLDFLEKNAQVPLLYLDFCNEKRGADAVISDSFYGAYTLTNYLFQMGHTKIAYVGTLLSTGSITDRYLGYVKSLMEHGCEPRKDWVIDDRYLDDGKIDVDKLIVLPKDMPTAFLCNCDLVASHLIDKLRKAGYRVPEDISVAGYDNYLFPGLCDIGITSYEVNIKEMTKISISMILKRIQKNSNDHYISIVGGKLIEKDSVKRIG